MKLKKAFLIIFPLTVLIGVLNVSAAGARFLENCYVNENEQKLVILCSENVSDTGDLSPKQLEITLGGAAIPIAEILGYGSSEIPATYCCLVDISGSMNASQMELAKETLLRLTELMGEKDNMAIGTLGNSLDLSSAVSDKNSLTSVINSLSAGNEDTNLYAGIVNGIAWLNTSAGVNQRKCLVVISDGMDDMVSGYTREEAVRAISESSIPIYTVAALRGDNQAENGKALGELARLSPGGRHYAPVIDGISGADAGAGIANSVKAGFVIKADIPESVTENRDKLVLRIKSTSSGGSVTEDTMTLYAEDLKQTAEPAESAAPAGTEEQKQSVNNKLMIMLPAAALLAIAVIFFVIVGAKAKKRKKKTDNGEEQTDGNTEKSEENQIQAETAENIDFICDEDGIKRNKCITVHLTAIGNTDKYQDIRLTEGQEITLGCDKKSDIVVDAADNNLSGTHCALLYKGEKVYLRDAGSKNDTFHNGVPINTVGRIAVNQDDTIRIGSYTYRIVW